MDFNNLAGLGLSGYGVGAVVYSQMVTSFEPSPKWWAQVAVALVGGFSILIFNNYSKIKLPSFKKAVVVEDKIFTPEECQEMDLKCFAHLRGRLLKVNDEEGLRILNQLNSRFFLIDAEQK